MYSLLKAAGKYFAVAVARWDMPLLLYIFILASREEELRAQNPRNLDTKGVQRGMWGANPDPNLAQKPTC